MPTAPRLTAALRANNGTNETQIGSRWISIKEGKDRTREIRSGEGEGKENKGKMKTHKAVRAEVARVMEQIGRHEDQRAKKSRIKWGAQKWRV